MITRAFADLCNPEAGYEPETAQNSIELKKGEYHDYHIYLNATRYTVEPGHSLALVITTEDPINCLIHKIYSVEIENASVTAGSSDDCSGRKSRDDEKINYIKG